MADQIKQSMLPPSEHESAIAGRTSLALHLGGYDVDGIRWSMELSPLIPQLI